MKLLHGSPGFGIQLTEKEIIKFLSDSKLNLHLGTVDEEQYPNIHPTWYIYDNSKDAIFIETSKHSKKINNLKKNDKIYFCVDDGNPPYKGIRGKGSVRILTNRSSNGKSIARKRKKWKFGGTGNKAEILLYMGL
jgi:nitroimidazol reductase NimA-like FMN-containing flavoprotein (pyridoxamine 5'-phosphate oxidase superfamily)